MRKFHPSKFVSKYSASDVSASNTLVHSCTGCGKHHPHSGSMVVTQWCDQCSPVSIYKATSQIMLRENTPRQMISVMV